MNAGPFHAIWTSLSLVTWIKLKSWADYILIKWPNLVKNNIKIFLFSNKAQKKKKKNSAIQITKACLFIKKKKITKACYPYFCCCDERWWCWLAAGVAVAVAVAVLVLVIVVGSGWVCWSWYGGSLMTASLGEGVLLWVKALILVWFLVFAMMYCRV